jgi:hypothetical protein
MINVPIAGPITGIKLLKALAANEIAPIIKVIKNKTPILPLMSALDFCLIALKSIKKSPLKIQFEKNLCFQFIIAL